MWNQEYEHENDHMTDDERSWRLQVTNVRYKLSIYTM